MASRDTVEMTWKGMKYAAILPILGSTLGAWKLCNCFQHIAASRGELLRRATASCVMLGVPVVYGFCVAAMIHVHLDKRDFDSGNASFAAGLLVGLTGGFCSAAVGVFSDKAIRAVLRQPRLFAAIVLILIFLNAFSMYGLIVSLVTLTKSATFGDVPYTDAVQLTSCASCANHLEQRLLDQAQARASYTPLFWGHSRSIPQGMILDVQPLVKSLFCPIRASPNGIF